MPDETPVPTDFIRYTNGIEDHDQYQQGGLEAFRMLALAAQRYGSKPIGAFGRVLDFGCGSGRLLQYVPPGPEMHGCEVNAQVAAFTRGRFPHATIQNNAFEPPLDFPDRTFDLVFSFSVFSHLRRDIEDRWLAELNRVGEAGCLYLITVHGDWQIECLLPPDARAQVKSDGFLYREGYGRTGGPLDFPVGYEASYHTSAYIRGSWSRTFDVLDVIKGDDPARYLWDGRRFEPEGSIPYFRPMGQDLVVLRKR